MRTMKAICCAAAIVACIASGVRADEWNKHTFLTFSGPVQVPGATLPAGTYMFKLADLQSNRHVVQIFDKDGKKIYATILAIPDQRLEPSDKPVVMFAETPAGTPAAVKAWFYPGDTIGDEFVYPRREAIRIAQTTHQPVLSRSDESSDMKGAEVERVDENGNPVNADEHARANESTKPAETTTTAGTETTTAGQSANPYGRPANERPNADQNKPAVSGTTGTTTPVTTDQSAATTGQADQNPKPSRQNLPKTASP